MGGKNLADVSEYFYVCCSFSKKNTGDNINSKRNLHENIVKDPSVIKTLLPNEEKEDEYSATKTDKDDSKKVHTSQLTVVTENVEKIDEEDQTLALKQPVTSEKNNDVNDNLESETDNKSLSTTEEMSTENSKENK